MSEHFGTGTHEIRLAAGMTLEITLKDFGARTGVRIDVNGRSNRGLPCAITVLPDRTNGYPLCGARASHPEARGFISGTLGTSEAETCSVRNRLVVCVVGDDFTGTLTVLTWR
jgi:hypothetical protein